MACEYLRCYFFSVTTTFKLKVCYGEFVALHRFLKKFKRPAQIFSLADVSMAFSEYKYKHEHPKFILKKNAKKIVLITNSICCSVVVKLTETLFGDGMQLLL